MSQEFIEAPEDIEAPKDIEAPQDIEDFAEPHTEILGRVPAASVNSSEQIDPEWPAESPLPEFPKAILTRFVKQLSGDSGIKISQEYKSALVACLQTTVYYLSFLYRVERGSNSQRGGKENRAQKAGRGHHDAGPDRGC